MKNKNIIATVSIKEIKEISIVARRWFQSSYLSQRRAKRPCITPNSEQS